jgi:PPOX class probable F420-dependent enzyme
MTRSSTPVDNRARQFLEACRLAHLATADASGAPHVVPICFVLVDDTVYVVIDHKPKTAELSRVRRLRNIAVNPRVSIVADVYHDEDWSRLGFVLVRAAARIVVQGVEHKRALSALREKYAQYRRMALEDRPIIAADIEAVTSWGTLDVPEG